MDNKQAKNFLDVVRAFDNGEQIQIKIGNEWKDIDDWHFGEELRIKPKEEPKEKHYRPFKNCDELKMWFYINKNGISKSVAEELSKITPPSIWVRHKSNKDDQCMITHFGKIEANTIPVVEIRGMDLTMKELFENWEFLDGSDCGVKDDL